MKKKIKIGIDIHGVADTIPEMFRILNESDIEIHIITGGSITKKFKDYITNLGIRYDYLFSITDSLIDNGENVRWEDSENPWFDALAWDSAKAKYCEEHNIDLMFDDTERYAKYFTNKENKTKFILLKKLN